MRVTKTWMAYLVLGESCDSMLSKEIYIALREDGVESFY